ncbi:VOC family protein [Tepidibacter hydrothermalis]|uniref:VOC family protein n=1 Tax=Tepidibacter hydrothermalis TaxID=3036126 RepID=A0ABY8EAH1_9FIRM|nr:VOC family protein [Tepidibacter hydrothermalis]WFD09905.1 VOC family protein [Tepidibacter hydrothermalis]
MYCIDHISIVVSDIEKSTEFYEKVFDCKIIGKMEDERLKFVYLDVSGQTIELLQYIHEEYKRERGVIDHIAFKVDDIEYEIKKMNGLGIKQLLDSYKVVGKKKIMFYEGLDGERIELVENF